MALFLLTVSFGSIFQTERDGEHGVILKELCGEGIPPEIVTVLKADKESFLSSFIPLKLQAELWEKNLHEANYYII